MKKTLVIFATILLMAGSAWGADYYAAVSDVGAGNCTVGNECDLAQAIAAATSAGDTVHLLAGTYTTQIAPAASGSDGSPITFQIKAGEAEYSAIISTSSIGALLDGDDWIVIDGLYFNNTGSHWIQLKNQADYNIIQNCKFYDA